ncbi:hypothetical protein [Microcoleus sp. AT3-D2]|uniref:hypothetical protein n=1 Tax=Microcoleus sp. AT3-D2 TaxID=2818612 RepID=UPI002FD4B1C0
MQYQRQPIVCYGRTGWRAWIWIQFKCVAAYDRNSQLPSIFIDRPFDRAFP